MNVLGLCAGVGGLELGLHLAEPRANPVAFVEKDPFCQGVLSRRWPNCPIWTDVTTFHGFPWRGKINIVTAGFPCQPDSLAGRRRGTSDERWIFPDVARTIREVEPEWVFLENVAGILTGGMPHVLGALATLGYDVVWSMFSCEGLGASHQRKRVFLVAHAQGLQCGQGRKPSTERPGRSVRTSESLAPNQEQPLGNADSQRLQAPAQYDAGLVSMLTGSSDDGLGLWAPCPEDDWGSIARASWPIELPVCGVANGFPRGLEPDRRARIRALGNAVSPPVAAVAWRVLKASVMGEIL